MRHVVKYIIISILLWAAIRVAAELAPIFTGAKEMNQYIFLGSFICGAILALVTMRHDFYRTLEHEVTHILFAALLFRKPQRLVVNKGNGEAAYSGKTHILINLAPYFFPLTAVVIALASLLVRDEYRIFFETAFLFAMGYHIVFIIYEIFNSQPDLKEYGTVFSLGFLTVILIAVTAVTTVLVFDRAGMFTNIGKSGFYTMKHDVFFLYGKLESLACYFRNKIA